VNRLSVLALPLLLAACATTPREGAADTWLVGTWLMPDESTPFPLGCESDQPIRYEADGRFAVYEESGTWRLDGDRLTETLTEAGEPGDIGRHTVTRVVPSGPDAFVKHWPDGASATFRRCPP
jgi:hypothetical protein